jgi:hypothetical protein
MSVCEKASVRKDKAKGYVRITFCPDLKRFHGCADGTDLIADMKVVLQTRVLEIAAMAGKEVKVSFNGVHIETNTFEKFVRLFTRDNATLSYERCGVRWEVAAVLTRSLFSEDQGTPEDRHISFANGINTRKGGKHVDTVQRHVLGDICESAQKKRKLDIKPLPEGVPSQSRAPSSGHSSTRSSPSSAPAKMSDPFFYKPYEPSAAPQTTESAKPEEKKVGITPAKPTVGALLGGFKKK